MLIDIAFNLFFINFFFNIFSLHNFILSFPFIFVWILLITRKKKGETKIIKKIEKNTGRKNRKKRMT